MKFLVDAQLPRRLAKQLEAAGHDAVHTLDLIDGNRTSDAAIIELADREGRVVVTKDADFVVSYTLFRKPRTLLLIATGNIANSELSTILHGNLEKIVTALESGGFVEVNRDHLTYHE